MGKLFKRGETWFADYFDRDGQRRRASTRTSDVKVARARLRDLELATTHAAAHPTEALAAALTYFVDVVHAASSPGTVRCYAQKAGHLGRLLGESRELDALTRATVDSYIATRLGEGAHPHTVHKELVVLRGALKSARARDRFHGPADLVPAFSAGYTPRTAYLTPDQFVSLASFLVPPCPAAAAPRTRERWELRRQRRLLYCLLIALASPRVGELEALRWEHVDLGRGVLRIPKGKTVGRPIGIHPLLRLWLETLHRGAGPVVPRWANVGRDLPAACERAGVPRCTPNDLRRTFASWLVQGGESLLVVSRLLGHASTRMVDMVYGQLDEATLTGAIARLPGWDAGGRRAATRGGTVGDGGTPPGLTSITDSIENPVDSAASAVPRDGVEPPTRGFSGLSSLAPRMPDKGAQPQRKLRSVK